VNPFNLFRHRAGCHPIKPKAAIAREKQIKGRLIKKKFALIESLNPKWQDLSEGWYG
jgi:predicted GIY-YIG superfamily endonuclease